MIWTYQARLRVLTLEHSRAGSQIRMQETCQVLLLVFFFFQAPPATDPVVQWSVQWPDDITRYLTEPECNGSVEQRLKEGTPVRQNRPGIEPGPPETLPAQRGT